MEYVSVELVEAHAFRVVVEERIAELIKWRAWYRARPWTLDWPSRRDNDEELRRLVHLVRKARKAARPVIERTDPMTMAGAR